MKPIPPIFGDAQDAFHDVTMGFHSLEDRFEWRTNQVQHELDCWLQCYGEKNEIKAHVMKLMWKQVKFEGGEVGCSSFKVQSLSNSLPVTPTYENISNHVLFPADMLVFCISVPHFFQ